MKTGTEYPHFPFIGKSGLNVEMQDSENSLETAELIGWEKNQYAQQSLK